MVINPSLLIQDGQILVAARRHRRETLQRNGIYHGPEGAVIDVIDGRRRADLETGTARTRGSWQVT